MARAQTAIVDEEPDGAPFDADFAVSVIAGLSASPKTQEPKWLYDTLGAKLFEAICEVDTYYPTRMELAVLTERAAEIADSLGEDLILIEPGSGEGVKVRLLLEALGDRASVYVPVDIAADQLIALAQTISATYPQMLVAPVVADFTGAFTLPGDLPPGRRVLFFPGSTIGNFEPDAAAALLERLRLESRADALLIGIDTCKDPERLVAAYDDPVGVTAAFNKNLLNRINRELGGTFDLDAFRHEARFVAEKGCVQMHLVSLREQSVEVLGERFTFAEGESIHTESSYKYAPEEFATLAERAGWTPESVWTDDEGLFSLHLVRAAG